MNTKHGYKRGIKAIYIWENPCDEAENIYFILIFSVNSKCILCSQSITFGINYNAGFLLFSMPSSFTNLFSIVLCGPNSLPRYLYKSTEAKQAKQSLK